MLESVGLLLAGVFAGIGDVSIFAGRTLRDAFRPPYETREVVRQLFDVGWRSLPLVATSGFAVGIVLSMHTRASLEQFGAESLIPAGLGIAMILETGPLITGLLVSGRVGAGIGAEISAMKVTEQIDALEATAVDSFKYLAVTRAIACVVALPVLTVVMDFAGIVGGFTAETIVSGMSLSLYLRESFALIAFSDFLPATLKTSVFGFIIAVVSSYLGFTATHGTEGVGRASTRSVVFASILIILADVLLVRLIFFLYPEAGAA
jgi:phospholipid/cholesterol/gamma-HCH transport system permease protein